MTDREIIIDKFVDKYYTISNLSSNGNIKVSGIKNKDGTFEYKYPNAFYKNVITLYSNFITDEKISVLEMVEDWYNSKQDEIYSVINKYLDENVNVSLDTKNWVVNVNGEIWSWKELVIIFDGYDKQSVKFVYDKWFSKKVGELSEEILNENYY